MGGRGVFSASAKAYSDKGINGNSGAINVTDKYLGMTLAQTENILRQISDHEEAVIFDRNMNLLLAVSGDVASVLLPDSLKERDGITITHNHLQNANGYGAGFSPGDVSFFATSRAAEIRAVAGGQGEYVYSLSVRGRQSDASVEYAKSQLNLWANRVYRDATPKKYGGTGKLQDELIENIAKL